jgi:putative transposase
VCGVSTDASKLTPWYVDEERSSPHEFRLVDHRARIPEPLEPEPRESPPRPSDANSLYKAELIHRRAPWKTKESLELATLEWVSWFNHHRLLALIGYIPPDEAEANYYRHLAEQVAIPA